jgi:hypothetical protein
MVLAWRAKTDGNGSFIQWEEPEEMIDALQQTRLGRRDGASVHY